MALHSTDFENEGRRYLDGILDIKAIGLTIDLDALNGWEERLIKNASRFEPESHGWIREKYTKSKKEATNIKFWWYFIIWYGDEEKVTDCLDALQNTQKNKISIF